MKIQIRDREAFDGLDSTDLTGYLRAANWRETRSEPGRLSWWAKSHEEGEAKILVPFDRTYRDFATRLADAVQLIAAVEGRSQLAVLDDIRTSGYDIVRIQLDLADAADGTVSVERGAALYDNLPKLFAAGACAARGPRLYYGRRPSKPVEDFLKQLRYGQTEAGSYVVRQSCPPFLPPSPGIAKSRSSGGPSVPFSAR